MGSLTQWRGQSDTTLGRFGWGFLMSLLLHLPLTPLAALFGLLTLLSATKPPVEKLPELTGIPVELLEGEEAEAPPAPTPLPPAPEPAAIIEPPAEKPERHEPSEPKIRDAGVSDAEPSDAATDAADAAAEETDAGIQDGGITDPFAVSGAQKIADPNANVKITIYNEKIRNHALAPRVSQALSSVPQWRDFFGPAALDPVKDVDRLYIWGPQMRDSSEVGVVAKVNVPQKRVREAIDGIVSSDPATGAWLDGGIPAATARVDRAPRVFVMTSKTTVVVVPPSAAENVVKNAKNITVKPSSGTEVVTAHVATPWRAFRHSGLDFEIPKSIEWARIKVTPDEYGGAIIEVEAKDESAEKASENARYLERALRARTNFVVFRIVERIVFTTQGDKIHGYALMTNGQIKMAMDFALEKMGARSRGSSGSRPPNVPTDAGTPAPETPKPRKPKSETPELESPVLPTAPAEPSPVPSSSPLSE